MIVLELDLASMPSLQNQLTYFGLRTNASIGTLRLGIDRGDGQWRYGRHLPGRRYHSPKLGTQAGRKDAHTHPPPWTIVDRVCLLVANYNYML